MIFKRVLMALPVLFIICSAAIATEEERPGLEVKLSVEKELLVKDKDGTTRTEWQEAGESNPGDVLKYTISYKNRGRAEAREAVILDPVPEGTVYIGGSAEGKDTEITFSLDGTKFETPPMLRYTVKQSDGTEKEYTATPDMYRHIKWKLLKPVLPDNSGTLSFRVRVK